MIRDVTFLLFVSCIESDDGVHVAMVIDSTGKSTWEHFPVFERSVLFEPWRSQTKLCIILYSVIFVQYISKNNQEFDVQSDRTEHLFITPELLMYMIWKGMHIFTTLDASPYLLLFWVFFCTFFIMICLRTAGIHYSKAIKLYCECSAQMTDEMLLHLCRCLLWTRSSLKSIQTPRRCWSCW